MDHQAALLIGVLALALVLFVTQVVRIEVTALGLVVALPLLGLLSPEQALTGFSSPATITVAAMLVMSAGLERAGVVDWVVAWMARFTGGGLARLLLVLAVPSVLFSAFVNNTPVVAMMIPVALALARRSGLSPSKVLIPLSYFSILGGTCTLFGTSTNILVDVLWRDAGGPGFEVFEFSRLGLVFVGVGVLYVLAVGARILPERAGLTELLAASAPGRFVTEVVLEAESRYDGQRLRDAFPARKELTVIEVVRGEEPILQPDGDFVLRAGDVLFVESTARSIAHLLEGRGVSRGTAVADDRRVPLHELFAGEALERPSAILDPEPEDEGERVSRVDLRIAEAVVTPNSRFVGRRVGALGLSRKYGVAVLAIRRLGRQHQFQLREFRLRPGDVLLVQGEPSALRLLHEEGDVLLVEGVESSLTFPDRAPLAIGVLSLVVLLASLRVAPIVLLALAGVGALLATRCLTPRQAIGALEPEVVLLLAGTIPLGLAMQEVGLADSIAAAMGGVLDPGRPWLLVGGLYLFTVLLTEVLSNNATAVLLTPIALSLAAESGLRPEPLLLTVAFGASASFSTPIGYQTNALVMGPGGYRFGDYLRFGLPLSLALTVIASLVIPRLWPLT